MLISRGVWTTHIFNPQELISSCGGDASALTRVDAGLALLKAKPLWRLALALGCALRVTPASAAVGAEASGAAHLAAAAALAGKVSAESPEELRARVQPALELYQAFESRIAGHGLEGVWENKPLLNGGDVMAAVGARARCAPALLLTLASATPISTRDLRITMLF